MKKIFYAAFCTTLLLLTGCDKNESEKGPGKGDLDYPGKTSWKALVKKHPFLSEFPAFQGEIENHHYTEIMGSESVVFFDYSCEPSVATIYYDKINSAGFIKIEEADIWNKTVSGKEYTFSGGYAGGSFALSFSCTPQD